MTRKIFTLFSLVLTAAFVLAACGPAATSAPPTAVPATAMPPTAEPAKPVTIEWWHINTQDPGKTLWQNYGR